MTRTEQLQARFEAAFMPNYGVPPVALVRGEGCQVWDADGNQYTDLIAGIAVGISVLSAGIAVTAIRSSRKTAREQTALQAKLTAIEEERWEEERERLQQEDEAVRRAQLDARV